MMHTIIVGSGISGLAAAAQLIQAGKQVLVLEANDYVGGRLKTKCLNLLSGKNFMFDYGASWIHGSCQEHPITALAKEFGLKYTETDDDKMEVYNEKGKEIEEQADQEFDEYEKIQDKMQEWQGQDVSYYKALKTFSSEKIQDPVFMFHVANDIEFQTSADIKDLSCKDCIEDDEFQGKQMLVYNGYQQLCEGLIKKFNIKILVNHVVTSISKKGGISEVICQNGMKFNAENIIISVPLGVLKKGNISFSPKLPAWKQQAIDDLGFGNVCKIVIDLKKSIFQQGNKSHYIGVVADDPNQRGFLTYFMNLETLTNLPILMTFGLGANSDEAEFMPQAELKAVIAQRINCFADQPVTPKDFNITRTSWKGTNTIGGAYTYPRVGTKYEDWKAMARPIFQCRWYFCGEHTTSRYRGTVHGAYLSGQYAAQSILKKVQDQDWKYIDSAWYNGEQKKKQKPKKSKKAPPQVGSRKVNQQKSKCLCS